MTNPTCTIATTDTAFAASLMTRGGKLTTWAIDPSTGKVEWQIENVEGEWVDDYRTGRDQFQMLLRNRTMLVAIAKSLKKQ